MSFSVLFVCTGNICRSPVGERLFKARISDNGVTVASAGTSALVGYGIDGPSALVLRELGGDPTGHSAQRITRVLVQQADLILTAESSHRSRILHVEPGMFRKTFTMREFARLGSAAGRPEQPLDEAGLRQRVGTIAGLRGQVGAAEAGGDEVGDPYGAGLDFARLVIGQISTAVDAAIATLGLDAGVTPPARRRPSPGGR